MSPGEASGEARSEGSAWQARLRESGHRLTPQRELVLAAVETLGHATPDEVYAEVRTHSQSINLSTVYRTLELLDELGLIRHAHLTDRAPTYHSAAGHEHAHFVCRGCQKMISIGRGDAVSSRLTRPPASLTSRAPAAKSQAFRPRSKYPSRRPAAT